MLFFHLGSVKQGDAFFDRYWPGARAVSDEDQRYYTAFGLTRGKLRQVLGPTVWARGLIAALKGNFAGRPAGDVLAMPGAFLVQDSQVLWRHESKNSADNPDFAAIPDIARRRASQAKAHVDPAAD